MLCPQFKSGGHDTLSQLGDTGYSKGKGDTKPCPGLKR